MRYVWMFAKVVTFVLLLIFAVNNSQPVKLNFLYTYEWNLPLVIVLFMFFAAGVALGLMSLALSVFRLRNELKSARRELRVVQEQPLRSVDPVEDSLA